MISDTETNTIRGKALVGHASTEEMLSVFTRMDELELLLDETDHYRRALRMILAYDPETDSDEGWNEWGEADGFTFAQNTAREALKR